MGLRVIISITLLACLIAQWQENGSVSPMLLVLWLSKELKSQSQADLRDFPVKGSHLSDKDGDFDFGLILLWHYFPILYD